MVNGERDANQTSVIENNRAGGTHRELFSFALRCFEFLSILFIFFLFYFIIEKGFYQFILLLEPCLGITLHKIIAENSEEDEWKNWPE